MKKSMGINIIIKGRYKDNPEVAVLFKYYKSRMKSMLEKMARPFRVKLPKSIILRPMYVREGYYPYHGRIQWCPEKGWEILMNIETCAEEDDRGLSILRHECVHLIEYLTEGSAGHGNRFRKIEAACESSRH
ncbi:MAG: hypothetical protein C4581_13580 [Nitrospiraceae bacterium]|nr:MAG: hypothetical protein C4581_13580 [Nitrospiraceae bacterium]